VLLRLYAWVGHALHLHRRKKAAQRLQEVTASPPPLLQHLAEAINLPEIANTTTHNLQRAECQMQTCLYLDITEQDFLLGHYIYVHCA
jgi:hypothetical protein